MNFERLKPCDGAPLGAAQHPFQPYFDGLERTAEKLRSNATFPNVLLPANIPSPLSSSVVTCQPAETVQSYAQLFGRLPGKVVVLPESVLEHLDPNLFRDYFNKWYRPIYGYCPEILTLDDEVLARLIKEGQIQIEKRSYELICYYPVIESDNLRLGNKALLRVCLENSPVQGCKDLLIPGSICPESELEQELRSALRERRKVVVQTPNGGGGFGTWVVEKTDSGIGINGQNYEALEAAILEIKTRANSDQFLVTQYVDHIPVSVGAVLTNEGYVLGSVRRQLVDGSSYRGIYFDPQEAGAFRAQLQALETFLRDHCRELPRDTRIPPIIGFDFLLNARRLLITECNARQTGALPLEMLLVSVRLGGEPLYLRLTFGDLSAFQLDHCIVPTEWAKNLELFEREFPRTIRERFGLSTVFLPTVAREDGLEAELGRALSTSETIVVAPATPPNRLTGKIAIQFFGLPETVKSFFDSLTNYGQNLEPKLGE